MVVINMNRIYTLMNSVKPKYIQLTLNMYLNRIYLCIYFFVESIFMPTVAMQKAACLFGLFFPLTLTTRLFSVVHQSQINVRHKKR